MAGAVSPRGLPSTSGMRHHVDSGVMADAPYTSGIPNYFAIGEVPIAQLAANQRLGLASAIFSARRNADSGLIPSALASEMNSSTSIRRAPVST